MWPRVLFGSGVVAIDLAGGWQRELFAQRMIGKHSEARAAGSLLEGLEQFERDVQDADGFGADK